MSAPANVPRAKLVCVSMATIYANLNCAKMPGFYRIVWELPDYSAADDPAERQRMFHHYLFGKVICAN